MRSPSAASRFSRSGTCSARRSTSADARAEVLDRTLAAAGLGPRLGPRARGVARELPSERAGRAAHRRHRIRRAAVRDHSLSALARRGRLRAPAAAEPPLHARHLGLGLRRRLRQPHGQAGPRARGRAPRRHLPPPPALRRTASSPTGAKDARRPVARGRRRARRSATAACSSAWASAPGRPASSSSRDRLFAAGAARPRDRARSAGAPLRDASRHRHDDGRRATRSRSTRTFARA